MKADAKVNLLLVDDQPAKLLSYETILSELGENLIKASSAREAFEHLLKTDIAVVLVDVCMPELDGFELARLIRDHPRFHRTAIIFISAVLLADVDRLRAYEMGAVDYVPVPVIPEVLRAKVKVFVELYRKTRQLEEFNRELESRVAERTSELEASTVKLLQSERRRGLALKAGQMGSWHWNFTEDTVQWDQGQREIFGVGENFIPNGENIGRLIHPEDYQAWQDWFDTLVRGGDRAFQAEYRVCRPDGTVRWCMGSAAASFEGPDKALHVSGVTIDITDRRDAEERQMLLAREVDHRAKNALALVQSIVRLTRADDIGSFVAAVEGRISALSRAHALLAQSRWHGADLVKLINEEVAPYRTGEPDRVRASGLDVSLQPPVPQTLALAVHELATNAAKYGALSVTSGKVAVNWELQPGALLFRWAESGGPKTKAPSARGFGMRAIISSIERQLGGKVTFDWKPNGLTCTMTIPLSEQPKAATRSDSIPPRVDGDYEYLTREQAGKRVLLVEDEALIALMTAEYLAEIGYSVVGPFRTTAEAMPHATTGDIDVAVLDVNLGGEYVYPVASALSERGVPIIFTTGYGAESIDKRFTRAPILNKPVQFEELRRHLATAKIGGMPAEIQPQHAATVMSAR